MRERRYRRRPLWTASPARSRCPYREEGHQCPTHHHIDRDQRSGLYEVIRNHLALVQDFWVAMERTKDGAMAERLGLEFAEDFRLLQDVGWGKEDERETFELTMPAHDLMELVKRLHDEAVKVLVDFGTEARSSREDAETDRRFQIWYETCNKLLAELDPRVGESA